MIVLLGNRTEDLKAGVYHHIYVQNELIISNQMLK
jgi:hypothetical protein